MKWRLPRQAWLVLGLLCLGLGIAGYFIPGIPGTGPLILAVYCFQRSSKRLENWLLNHKRFGRTLREWYEHKALRPRTKLMITAMLWPSLMLSAVILGSSVGSLPARVGIWALFVATGVGVSWYVWTRPSLISQT